MNPAFRRLAAVASLIASSSVLATGAFAQSTDLTRPALERRLLDVCVYRQYAADAVRDTMIEKCRCAAREAMKQIEGESFAIPRSGGLTPVQDTAIRTGIGACFPPKK